MVNDLEPQQRCMQSTKDISKTAQEVNIQLLLFKANDKIR